MKKLIFHLPWTPSEKGDSGSQKRPVSMQRALVELAEVHLVAGKIDERRRAASALLQRIERGERFDGVYGEFSTQPLILASGWRNVFKTVVVDLRLLWSLKRRRVPIGLFYRDLHWRFPHYESRRSWAGRSLYRAAYRLDFFLIDLLCDVLFVPHRGMVDHFPTRLKARIVPLPPGADQQLRGAPAAKPKRPLRLIYVGGIGKLYDISALMAAVASLPSDVELVICTRKVEWESHGVGQALPANIRVVHASGDALRELYAQSDVGCVMVEPSAYWSFVEPVKMYEYLAHGLPVLAASHTAPGEFVAANGIGWVAEAKAESIATQLRHLVANPDQVSTTAERASATALNHTWRSRAQTALTALKEPLPSHQ